MKHYNQQRIMRKVGRIYRSNEEDEIPAYADGLKFADAVLQFANELEGRGFQIHKIIQTRHIHYWGFHNGNNFEDHKDYDIPKAAIYLHDTQKTEERRGKLLETTLRESDFIKTFQFENPTIQNPGQYDSRRLQEISIIEQNKRKPEEISKEVVIYKGSGPLDEWVSNVGWRNRVRIA